MVIAPEDECASTLPNVQLHIRRKLVLEGPGGAGSLPSVYGVCGMEVGELFGGTSAKELVVGALDGHLQVYSLNHGTGDFGAMPIFNEQVEGAVGLFNSIVIADLDANPGNELYVAGSLGLRRWVP